MSATSNSKPLRLARELQWLDWLSVAVALHPLVLLLSLYITWMTATVALGHLPQPVLDDPKNIGAIDVPYNLTALLFVTIPISLAINFILIMVNGISRAIAQKLEAPGFQLVMLFSVGAWVCSLLLFTWDPLRVWYWYAD